MVEQAGRDADDPDDEFEPPPAETGPWPPLADLAACLRFYSRLPVPALAGAAESHAAPDFRTLPRMLPLAGLLIGLLPALALLGGLGLGLGPFLAATLAALAATLVTGALHEDGLADVADGFGGGTTPERRLAIMRDSRIGAYGAAALVLAYCLRIGGLATLTDRVGWRAALVVLLAAALSRTAALWPMLRLDPARPDGAARAVGRPSERAHNIAWATCLGLVLVAGLLGLPWIGLALALGLAFAAAWAVTRMAERLIGGQTGDVIGAIQQAAEIAVLLGLLVALPP